MIYKLGTIIGHTGHAPPETERWAILKVLGIDVELAKQAVHKLYFEDLEVANTDYETYYDVCFIPNETKHGSMFAVKYGTKINE